MSKVGELRIPRPATDSIVASPKRLLQMQPVGGFGAQLVKAANSITADVKWASLLNGMWNIMLGDTIPSSAPKLKKGR